MEKFFKIISGIVNLFFLCGLLVLVWHLIKDPNRDREGEIKVENKTAKSPVYFRLGNIKHITGSDTDMIELYVRKDSGKFSSGSYGQNVTRNILFISGKDKTAHWLFPDQNKAFIYVNQLSQNEKTDTGNQPAKGIYFSFVPEDTNGDGELTEKDNKKIAVTKPDGKEFKELLPKVTQVISYEVIDNNQLAILYQIDSSIKFAKFSLVTFTKESETEITNVPTKF